MPSQDQMLKWTQNSMTMWFLDRINEKYGNLDAEWRRITTLDELAFAKGQADVLDYMSRLINEPDTVPNQTIPDDKS